MTTKRALTSHGTSPTNCPRPQTQMNQKPISLGELLSRQRPMTQGTRSMRLNNGRGWMIGGHRVNSIAMTGNRTAVEVLRVSDVA
ncbi:hypothetical protein HJC23_011576 [Cyclotella cryptica]|uniref:Uncharacterized protein n=1 Tax=Cyclotella cryptica TaxID=29204 RepID=A0ABD3QR97_9STRA